MLLLELGGAFVFFPGTFPFTFVLGRSASGSSVESESASLDEELLSPSLLAFWAEDVIGFFLSWTVDVEDESESESDEDPEEELESESLSDSDELPSPVESVLLESLPFKVTFVGEVLVLDLILDPGLLDSSSVKYGELGQKTYAY